MRSRSLALLPVLLAALALALVACGDDGDGAADSSPTAIPDANPELLGGLVWDVYVDMFGELRPLLEEAPAPAGVRSEYEAIVARHQDRLVDLGWQVAALDPEIQQNAQFAFETKLLNIDNDDARKVAWLRDAVEQYQSTDPAFAAELTDLSGYARYSFFWILREQDPAEADRLGVP